MLSPFSMATMYRRVLYRVVPYRGVLYRGVPSRGVPSGSNAEIYPQFGGSSAWDVNPKAPLMTPTCPESYLHPGGHMGAGMNINSPRCAQESA